MDSIQVIKVKNSKPEHVNQFTTSLTFDLITDEPVQQLKDRVEELEEMLRISKNTIDGLDKLVLRYRTAYDQLSQQVKLDPNVVDDDKDEHAQSQKRTQTCSLTISPGLLISHSEISQRSYDGVSCEENNGDSETYDGHQVSLSRNSFSNSSSLDLSETYQGSRTRNNLPRSDESTNGHQSKRIFCNSRTPSPLPDDMEDVSTPPGFGTYNSEEEEYHRQLENQRLERVVSVEEDRRKQIKDRPTFKNPEPNFDHKRPEVHHHHTFRCSTRRSSPAQSSWRHWTNPGFQRRYSNSTTNSSGFII
ncbi:hypothetical protein CROQUDRAFT_440701 [Cronartium quercuum f. sp. fusiforme G11]|uniref:Uncharacterized protein n=1 Tax=Cronartium quercuum f. sp. fusiforme G11 TaxID=708437 RepID=A0A9P6NL13_9BASI|nr:hypothetical protein CROQUDRAFT_440701 [Cronartium quercuum f. sp. fusiforme G11]